MKKIVIIRELFFSLLDEIIVALLVFLVQQKGFLLCPNPQIGTFWGHTLSILQPQGISQPPPLKNPNSPPIRLSGKTKLFYFCR